MSSNERWLTELPTDIDWTTQGDPLVEYLREEMPVHITLTNWLAPGRKSTDDALPSNGHCLYSKSLANRLVFAFLADGIRLFIETESIPVDISELEPWASAYINARDRLSRDEPEFTWWATIGPRTISVAGVTKVVEAAMVGNIDIRPANKPYTEGLDRPTHPSLGGANIVSSFPLVTYGTSRGYNWQVAVQRAAQDLNTVCCLLSLAFNAYWTLRTYPNLYDSPQRPEIETPAWALGFEGRDFIGQTIGVPQKVTVPAWFNQAIERLDSNPNLNSALHSHRQGLALMEEHPSLALVCFVGAIEGVGATLEEEITRCDSCRSHTGAQRRFRLALKTALSKKEIKSLNAVETYALRSQTAHAGTLHGEEMRMGGVFSPMSTFSPRPKSVGFQYDTLWKIRDASSRVLTAQLSS